jgi:protein-S-isoprenylcysteine O-methyltransferase Ste14
MNRQPSTGLTNPMRELNKIMSQVHIYALVIALYGIMDIVIQKNKKSIVSLKSKDRTYLPVLISFIITLAAVPFEYNILHKQVSWPVMISGIIICIIAASIRIKGHLDLGHGFSTRVEKQENHKLVTSGIYSLIRHPMYLAIILLLTGACLMLKAAFSWIFVILNFYTLHIRIKKEEKFMSENFPEYVSYINKTYKLFPFLY